MDNCTVKLSRERWEILLNAARDEAARLQRKGHTHTAGLVMAIVKAAQTQVDANVPDEWEA